jgi:hypothetical protein
MSLFPIDGIAEGFTTTVAAGASVLGPNGGEIVAVLSIRSPGLAAPDISTSKTIETEPLAGTLILVIFRKPAPFAPVPAPVELLVDPTGIETTLKPVVRLGMLSVTLTAVAGAAELLETSTV